MQVPSFFYGSYMDPDVLRRFGATPDAPMPARLTGWRLSFTPHANLVRDPDGVVEGFVYRLPHDQLDRLYGPNGFVTSYKPMPVLVEADPGRAPVMTFIEAADEQAPEGAYLESFLGICARLGLSDAYIADIKRQAEALVRGRLA